MLQYITTSLEDRSPKRSSFFCSLINLFEKVLKNFKKHLKCSFVCDTIAKVDYETDDMRSVKTQENEEEIHKMMLALTIIHVVISVVLIVAVLMQRGKQQGLSGAIAGGADTFFGKNKGRTIDAILKKVTAVVAILFVISSLTLAALSINQYNAENPNTDAQTIGSLDENGNLVDEEGNILMSAEDLAAAQNAEQAPVTEEPVAEGEEAPVEEATEEAPVEEPAEAPAAE